MSHQCKSILIHCMDFRLMKATKQWMEKQGYMGDCDVVSLAGASKELVDGSEQVRDLIMKQIKVSYELHGARQVILLHHSDCGAYKLSYNFASPEQEKEKQLEDTKKASDLILKIFPDINIITIWAQLLDPSGEEVKFNQI